MALETVVDWNNAIRMDYSSKKSFTPIDNSGNFETKTTTEYTDELRALTQGTAEDEVDNADQPDQPVVGESTYDYNSFVDNEIIRSYTLSRVFQETSYIYGPLP